MENSRGVWNSNIGFLLAAIGSAIGLGNVWRFSYMAHQYGGGAFLVPYVAALIIAGVPLMILEYGIGHRFRGASPLSFSRIGKKYEWLGWWMPVVAMFGIMLYYSVIIGWCVNYFVYSFTMAWGSDPQAFFFQLISAAVGKKYPDRPGTAADCHCHGPCLARLLGDLLPGRAARY